MPTAKNQFQVLNLHAKKHILKKDMVLKKKNTIFIYLLQLLINIEIWISR